MGDIREIEKRLEALNNEIINLKKIRNEAASNGNTKEERALSGKINQLTNHYTLLNDSIIKILDTSDTMKNLIKGFDNLDKELKQESKNLSEYGKAVDRAAIMVKCVAELVTLVA